jgi:hypothetical protein
MTEMNKVIPEPYIRRLSQFNIRSLEQFLSLAEGQGRADSLAATLDVSVQEIDSLVQKIHREYPNLKVPRRSTRKYYTGYNPS